MGPHFTHTVRLSNELEIIRALLDRHVSVRPEWKLQDPGEDMGQAAELLIVKPSRKILWVPQIAIKIVQIHVKVLDGDVVTLLCRHRMNLHGGFFLKLLAFFKKRE